MDNKIEKLKNLLKLVDESVSRADFENNFKIIVKAVQEFFQKANFKIAEIETKFTSIVNNIKENYNSDMEAVKDKVMVMCQEYIGTMIENHDKRMEAMEDEIKSNEADITPRIAEISLDLARSELLPLILDKDAINKNLSEQGALIADALENLDKENKLKIKAIEGLEEILEELRKTKDKFGGGGFNYGAVQLHLIDDETPSGAIDGSNKDFIINHAPSPTSSLKVFMNGQRLRIIEDYTFSGKTISFITAPPTGSVLLVDYRI